MNCCHCTERPKPKVTIKPAQHVFRGENVTLRCDIYDEEVTSWKYFWYKKVQPVFSVMDRNTHSVLLLSLTQVNTPVMDLKDHTGLTAVIQLH